MGVSRQSMITAVLGAYQVLRRDSQIHTHSVLLRPFGVFVRPTVCSCTTYTETLEPIAIKHNHES